MTEYQLRNHPGIELVAIHLLKPNERNPRTHSDKQIQQVSNSISRFGFVVPVVIDDEYRIVAGHARWRAAKLLKLTDVPSIKVAFLSEADRRAFALAENRLADEPKHSPVLSRHMSQII